MHSSQVGGQELAPRAPHCGSVPRVKAGLEAIARIGQVYANSSDAALFTDWAPGPYGEWSGDCKKLVNVAWYRATGVKLVSGNAKPTFDYYWARRSYKGGGNPAYGSLWASTSMPPTDTSRSRLAATASRPRVGSTTNA